jgi:hypothetical protein
MNPKKPQKIQANKSQKPIPQSSRDSREKYLKKKNSEINTNKISRSRRLREK